ncbi:MAG: hypothetical protein ACI4VX_04035 [Succinivibrionaceae bacterium]
MNIYNFRILNTDEKNYTSLAEFKNQLLLITITAPESNLSHQYTQLSSLYEKFHNRGFTILDFPCNQFSRTARGTSEEINERIIRRYHTGFPRFARIAVSGTDGIPLFRFLNMEKPFQGFNRNTPTGQMLHETLIKSDPDYEARGGIVWEFTKFLISRKGEVLQRFEPDADFAEIADAIEKVL